MHEYLCILYNIILYQNRTLFIQCIHVGTHTITFITAYTQVQENDYHPMLRLRVCSYLVLE